MKRTQWHIQNDTHKHTQSDTHSCNDTIARTRNNTHNDTTHSDKHSDTCTHNDLHNDTHNDTYNDINDTQWHTMKDRKYNNIQLYKRKVTNLLYYYNIFFSIFIFIHKIKYINIIWKRILPLCRLLTTICRLLFRKKNIRCTWLKKTNITLRFYMRKIPVFYEQ